MIRRWFTGPGARALFPPENHEQHARAHVASLRAVTAARPDDPGPAALVDELRAASREFEALWQSHDVVVRRPSPKRFLHPVVGALDLDCEVLLSDGHSQQLVVHSARPGTDTRRAARTAAGRRPPGPHPQLIVDAAPGHGARPLGASIPPPAGDRRAGCGPTRCAGRVPDGHLRAPGRGVGGTGALAGQAMRPVRGAVGVREVRCTTPTLGGGHRPANWPPFFIARELATTAARLRERDDPFPRTRCGRWRSITAEPPLSSVCCSATISGREG